MNSSGNRGEEESCGSVAGAPPPRQTQGESGYDAQPQIENDEPQPHVEAALGFSTVNRAPCKPSL